MKTAKNIENEIIYDYQNTNLKTQEIAEKYNLSRQTIRKILLRNNVELKIRAVCSTTVNEIISDYSNNIRNNEICKKYSLHRATIQKILIDNGIQLKSLKETSRKHTLVNENYFENIDCEEKAYILGLLYADGYINKNGFGITLVETDVDILEKLSIIFYDKLVLNYKPERILKSKYISKPQYVLNIASNKMKNDLIKLGCVPSKTFKIQLPKLGDENMYRHFIRGYFDGDGGICIPTKHPENITITITSNIQFCNQLSKLVVKKLNVNMKTYIRFRDVGGNRLTGKNQIKTFLDWIYKDASIYLERKYLKYKNYYNPVNDAMGNAQALLKMKEMGLKINTK